MARVVCQPDGGKKFIFLGARFRRHAGGRGSGLNLADDGRYPSSGKAGESGIGALDCARSRIAHA